MSRTLFRIGIRWKFQVLSTEAQFPDWLRICHISCNFIILYCGIPKCLESEICETVVVFDKADPTPWNVPRVLEILGTPGYFRVSKYFWDSSFNYRILDVFAFLHIHEYLLATDVFFTYRTISYVLFHVSGISRSCKNNLLKREIQDFTEKKGKINGDVNKLAFRWWTTKM